MPSISENKYEMCLNEQQSIRENEEQSISLEKIRETLEMLAKHVEIGCMNQPLKINFGEETNAQINSFKKECLKKIFTESEKDVEAFNREGDLHKKFDKLYAQIAKTELKTVDKLCPFEDPGQTIEALTLEERKEFLKYLMETEEKYKKINNTLEERIKKANKILTQKLTKYA